MIVLNICCINWAARIASARFRSWRQWRSPEFHKTSNVTIWSTHFSYFSNMSTRYMHLVTYKAAHIRVEELHVEEWYVSSKNLIYCRKRVLWDLTCVLTPAFIFVTALMFRIYQSCDLQTVLYISFSCNAVSKYRHKYWKMMHFKKFLRNLLALLFLSSVCSTVFSIQCFSCKGSGLNEIAANIDCLENGYLENCDDFYQYYTEVKFS